MITNPDGTPMTEEQIVLDIFNRIRQDEKPIINWKSSTVERLVAQYVRSMTIARSYGEWISTEVTARIVTAVWNEMQNPDPVSVYLAAD